MNEGCSDQGNKGKLAVFMDESGIDRCAPLGCMQDSLKKMLNVFSEDVPCLSLNAPSEGSVALPRSKFCHNYYPVVIRPVGF